MLITLDIKDGYGEVCQKHINVFYIVSIDRIDPRNADSDCVIGLRTGEKVVTTIPIYELLPKIDAEYKNCFEAVFMSIVVERPDLVDYLMPKKRGRKTTSEK